MKGPYRSIRLLVRRIQAVHQLQTIQQVADLVGVRYQTAHAWAHGQVIPSDRNLIKLARHAQLSALEVMRVVNEDKLLVDYDSQRTLELPN